MPIISQQKDDHEEVEFYGPAARRLIERADSGGFVDWLRKPSLPKEMTKSAY
ncbi:hypothetical protein [Novipirellula artificiosorum]|uniref:hypothetical protein n=1 Tax=Novipirellula artificiosorum TaxID=2528016 RepID=UPI0018CEDF0F|nr:hypothetical protein [Novipirellula artificiosorum]